ncbi:MAG: hypothetical protein DRN00_01560 [Thermoplasmata archaeon]|nr:MAG: hypothetical protein DRN00_01560 [Thermoplasmata archaeon]
MGRRRTLIIGLDGVPFSLLEDLAKRDVMPNVKELLSDGIFTKMKPTIPDVSSVSWSSIITGKNPGEHGVFGFTDIIKGTYTMAFHDFTKLKAPAFWQEERKKRYIIINVPSTYPAREINGLMVSGFVSPDLKRAVFPPKYLKQLEKVGYQIDIDVERCRKSPRLLFEQLSSVLRARLAFCEKVRKKIKWNVLMFVITGTDRLGHFLWSAYEDKGHEWHEAFLSFFEEVDAVIGRLVDVLSDKDGLIMLSDHGMERAEVEVNLNAYLIKGGYLRLGGGGRGYNSIRAETKAFALEPSRIYLNLEGRYPRGTVKASEADELLEELTDFFYQLEWDGKKVVKKVWRKDEIYYGPFLTAAPDLVLVPNKGFALNTKLFKYEVFAKSDLSGKHNEEAFLYVRGKENKDIVPDKPSVEDVVSIMRNLQR